MSADLLRRAAEAMRERAAEAMSAWGQQPWSAEIGTGWDALSSSATYDVKDSDGDTVFAAPVEELAVYASRLHPTFLLAVADWLDGVAERHVPMGHPQFGVLCCMRCEADLEDDERGHCDDFDDALAVARAYLGEGGATDAPEGGPR